MSGLRGEYAILSCVAARGSPEPVLQLVEGVSWRRARSGWPATSRAFWAGVVGSTALILHNPYPHALFALPWLISLAKDGAYRKYLLPLILGYLPVTIGIGVPWLLIKGSIGSNLHGDPTVAALANGTFRLTNSLILNMRAAALVKMLVWAVPGLFVLAALGYSKNRDRKHVGLLGQSAALTFIGYLLVNLDQGHGWGYRYFHSAWGVVPILAAAGITGPERSPRLESFAGAAAILSVLILVPLQLHQIDSFIARQMHRLPEPKKPGNDIFIIDLTSGSYIADLIRTDPFLREPDLFLVSSGKAADVDFIKQGWPSAVSK